jgi:hypothetical protein
LFVLATNCVTVFALANDAIIRVPTQEQRFARAALASVRTFYHVDCMLGELRAYARLRSSSKVVSETLNHRFYYDETWDDANTEKITLLEGIKEHISNVNDVCISYVKGTGPIVVGSSQSELAGSLTALSRLVAGLSNDEFGGKQGKL